MNPKVFLSVSVGSRPPKRIIIELYADTTPRTALKFYSVCTGDNISQLHYKNSTFHRICLRRSGPDNQLMGLCQGGTLPNSSKEEIESVYGMGKPENFIKKHDGFGTVSMVSPRGPQFFIMTGVSEINDGRHVVVGRVVDGVDVVWEIANVGSCMGEPLTSVVIVDCGDVRENPAPHISLDQKMSSKELVRIISTSNETLVNNLKKILNVNKQLIEVDPADFDLEDNESEEILDTMEQNLNHIFHLKAELCSLEKCHKQLLSHRTKSLSQHMKIPEAAHPAELVETSHQNTLEWNPHSFVSQEHESDDLSDASPLTNKTPPKKKKKKMKLVKTTPQNPACQAQKKCLHCETTETPQWRHGPLGAKTLCNACGMKYRNGRLLPQYRPAMSPTFDPSVHSNKYKKIAEMSSKGMFGDVATTSIDEESEFSMTESNALRSI